MRQLCARFQVQDTFTQDFTKGLGTLPRGSEETRPRQRNAAPATRRYHCTTVRCIGESAQFCRSVPAEEVGAEIGGDSEGIVSTDARVNYVAPGRWCLRCTGLVTPRRLAFESLTQTERKRKITLGYSDDLLIKQPAVMDLNMRAASAGVMVLRHLLQPFLLKPLPVTISENLVTYNMKPVGSARKRNDTCEICQENPEFAFGDCGKQVGLSSEVAKSLLHDEADDTASREQSAESRLEC